jgi:hypothetical protein
MDRTLDEVQDQLLAPLSDADRQTLTRLLTRLLDHHVHAASTGRSDHALHR